VTHSSLNVLTSTRTDTGSPRGGYSTGFA